MRCLLTMVRFGHPTTSAGSFRLLLIITVVFVSSARTALPREPTTIGITTVNNKVPKTARSEWNRIHPAITDSLLEDNVEISVAALESRNPQAVAAATRILCKNGFQTIAVFSLDAFHSSFVCKLAVLENVKKSLSQNDLASLECLADDLSSVEFDVSGGMVAISAKRIYFEELLKILRDKLAIPGIGDDEIKTLTDDQILAFKVVAMRGLRHAYQNAEKGTPQIAVDPPATRP